MRAAIYTRVSTDEQARHGVSLDAQTEACRSYCKLKHLGIVATLRDEGVSSGVPLAQRPAGRELCRLVERGEIEHVVVYSLSRLFRDNAEALTTSRDWDALGVSLHLLDVGGQAIDTSTAIGRFFFSVMAGAAELERNILRERVSGALQHIADTGRKPTGGLYGYRRRGGDLLPDPDTAPIVEEIFRRHARGDALMTIAQDLQRRGVPTPRGAAVWYCSTLRRILRNPAYAGRFSHRGELLPGDHEPLVTVRIWRKAQALLDARQADTAGRKSESLGALFACGHCGSRLCRAAGSRNHHRLDCAARRVQPRELRHEGIVTREDLLMEIVWGHTEMLLEGRDLSRAVAIARERMARDAGQRREVRRRIGELERQINRLLRAVREGAPAGLVEGQVAPLAQERERLLAQTGEPDTAALRTLERLAEGDVATLLARVRCLPAEEQVQWLRRLYSRIEVWRGRLRIHHRHDVLPPVDYPIPTRDATY